MATPDEIMERFEAASLGLADEDIHEILWEIIEDVRDSYRLAITTFLRDAEEPGGPDLSRMPEDVDVTVGEYLSRYYGDS